MALVGNQSTAEDGIESLEQQSETVSLTTGKRVRSDGEELEDQAQLQEPLTKRLRLEANDNHGNDGITSEEVTVEISSNDNSGGSVELIGTSGSNEGSRLDNSEDAGIDSPGPLMSGRTGTSYSLELRTASTRNLDNSHETGSNAEVEIIRNDDVDLFDSSGYGEILDNDSAYDEHDMVHGDDEILVDMAEQNIDVPDQVPVENLEPPAGPVPAAPGPAVPAAPLEAGVIGNAIPPVALGLNPGNQPQPDQLPPQWIQVLIAGGDIYYYNTGTGNAQLEHPVTGLRAPRVAHAPRSSYQSTVETLAASVETSDTDQQFAVLTDLCQTLVMDSARRLELFPLARLVTVLETLLSSTESYPVMLLACRVVAHLLDLFNWQSPTIATLLPLLVQKINTIEYIDVSEQAVLTLDRLADTHARSILLKDGVTLSLVYLEFFQPPAQRAALSVVAKCCRCMLAVTDCNINGFVPDLINRMNSDERWCSELVCTALCALVDNLRNDEEALTELAAMGLQYSTLQLLMVTPWHVSSSTVTSLLIMLCTLCVGSRQLATQLLIIGVAETLNSLLQQTLITTMSQRSLRQSALLSLIIQLMPALPANDLFAINETLKTSRSLEPSYTWQILTSDHVWHVYMSDNAETIENAYRDGKKKVVLNWIDGDREIDFEHMQHVRTANNENGVTRSVRRVSNMLSCSAFPAVTDGSAVDVVSLNPELTIQLVTSILPSLLDVFVTSPDELVVHKCLIAMQSIVHHCDALFICHFMQPTLIASRLSGLLCSREAHMSCAAVQMCHLLLNMMADIFLPAFKRTGVMQHLTELLERSLKVDEPFVPDVQPVNSDSYHIQPPVDNTEANVQQQNVGAIQPQNIVINNDDILPMELDNQLAVQIVPAVAEPVAGPGVEPSIVVHVDPMNAANDGALQFEEAEGEMPDNPVNIDIDTAEIDAGINPAATAAAAAAATAAAAGQIDYGAEEVSSDDEDSLLVGHRDVINLRRLRAARFGVEHAVGRRRRIAAKWRAAVALWKFNKEVATWLQKHAASLKLKFVDTEPFESDVSQQLQDDASSLNSHEVIVACNAFLGSLTEFYKPLDEKSLALMLRVLCCDDVTAFEVLDCGVIDVLYDYFLSHSVDTVQCQLLEVFSAISSTTCQTVSPFAKLVDLLLSCVHFLEKFELQVNDLPDELTGGIGGIVEFFKNNELDYKLVKAGSESDERYSTTLSGNPLQTVKQLTLIVDDAVQELLDEIEADDGSDDNVAIDAGVAHIPNPAASRLPRLIVGNTVLSPDMTVFQALATNTHLFYDSNIWRKIHVIKYDYPAISSDAAATAAVIPGIPPTVAHQPAVAPHAAILAGDANLIAEPISAHSTAPILSAFHSQLTALSELIGDQSSDTICKILHLLTVCHQLNVSLISANNNSVHQVSPLPARHFISTQLTVKIDSMLNSAVGMLTGNICGWPVHLACACPFLLPYETRLAVFRTSSFDHNRALMFYLSTLDNSDDKFRFSEIMTPQHIKQVASRIDILQVAETILTRVRSSEAVLDVQFMNEIGTGLGPTVEFYSLVSKELQKSALNLWRDDGVGSTESEYVFSPCGLFPAPLSPTDTSEAVNQIVSHFKMLGMLLARALLDSRLLDLPLSPVVYKWLLGRESTLAADDLYDVDSILASSLDKLQLHCKSHQPASCGEAAVDGKASLDDLCLTFVLPGHPSIELKNSGTSIAVTADNVSEYCQLVTRWTLVDGVSRQMQAMKHGFQSVVSLDSTLVFFPHELDKLFCGCQSEAWSIGYLRDCCQLDHGYTFQSPAIVNLFQILSEFSVDEQRQFIQFTTGSPRLPVGGLKSLSPPLTIVRKVLDVFERADDFLPSVMTCAAYLKLPEYSGYQVMKERLLFAMKEGQGSFHFS